MSLIKCGGCERVISEQAITCPECGHPGPKQKMGWFKANAERVGLTIVLLATGLQFFLVDKLREEQSSAEFLQLDYKIDHVFWALTSDDPSNYPAMSKESFKVFDYIGTDLWLNDAFGTCLGALFVLGSLLIVGSRYAGK